MPHGFLRGGATLLAAVAIASVVAPAAGRERHHVRRHRVVLAPAGRPILLPGRGATEDAAAASGFVFGLFDAGISGTATAVSPYAGPRYADPTYIGSGSVRSGSARSAF